MSRALISPPPMAAQPVRHSQVNSTGQNEAHKLDVIYLLKRKFLFILFFVMLGLVFSLLYFFKVPRTYESTAKIFVDEKNAPSTARMTTTPTVLRPWKNILRSSKVQRSFNPRLRKGTLSSSRPFDSSMTFFTTCWKTDGSRSGQPMPRVSRE